MSKYNLIYHLARGVIVYVDNVSENDFLSLGKVLEDPKKVISVSNRKDKHTQLIPVRNILAIDAQPVEAKDGDMKTIICDIDGTLAKMSNRSPYDWQRVNEDTVHEAVAELLRQLSMKTKIILFSGRDASCRAKTEAWLDKNHIPYHALYMRAEKDNRKDNIVKKELFEKYVKDEIWFVLDDRDQVVNMWRRELGLTCFQVAEGNF